MRPALIFALLSALAGCASPNKATVVDGRHITYRWQHAAAPAALSAFSGACYGMHETVVHHPDRIPASWDRQWWDGRVSWTNKGHTLWGKTFGSFGTDAKHTFGPLHRWSLFAAGVTVPLGERRPFIHYVADAGISFVAFSAGFHLVYSGAFR